MVRLQDVWQAGCRYNFPLVLLRLLLEAFSFGRYLMYQGAVSSPTHTLSAILAGAGFAQVALLLVLMGPSDAIQGKYSVRGLTLCTYVDDIALQVAGTEAEAAGTIVEATCELVQWLEEGLLMKVSRREQWSSKGIAKTVATATPALLRRIRTSMRRLGIGAERKAKHLGILHGPGAKTKEGRGGESRWISGAARCARVKKLGRRLGVHVFSTGLKPAVLYGSSVAVPRLSTLKAMRRAAGRTIRRMKGRSLTARLTVNKCDLAWDTLQAPMLAWVRAVWDCRVPRRTLFRAWLQGRHMAEKAVRPLAAAGGAAGALFASLRRIGWTSPSFDKLNTAEGTTLSLDAVAPKTLGGFLADDYQIVTAASSSLAAELHNAKRADGGHTSATEDGSIAGNLTQSEEGSLLVRNDKPVPWFEPARSVINSSWARKLEPNVTASVASIPEGGWWTQTKLCAAGLTEDPLCQACKAAVGSLPHRMFQCVRHAELVDKFCPRWLRQQAEANKDDTLFTHGVPLRPRCPATPPPMEQWIGKPPTDGAVAVGTAYIDGALRGVVPRARRAGWAYVVDQGDGKPFWGKRGTCSEDCPTVVRSELWALRELLRVACGPLAVYVDNLEVVNGVHNGREWCCHHKRDGADLWRQIWRYLDDMLGWIQVRKVKAHLDLSDVKRGRITYEQWVGNGVADLAANAACTEASRASPAHAVHSAWLRACAFYRWAAHLVPDWVDDTLVEHKQAERTRGAPTQRSPKPTSHELWLVQGQLWCRACGIKARAGTGPLPPALRRKCRGNMGARCAMH